MVNITYHFKLGQITLTPNALFAEKSWVRSSGVQDDNQLPEISIVTPTLTYIQQ